MVVIPVSGGDVVIVRIDKVFESAIVYLLRPQRAAIPGGANMSPMVVHDRVVVRSQVVVHADHNPLTDFRHERGAQVGLSSGCDGRYVEAPHHRCRPARIDLHRRLTLEELVITGGDSVVVDGNSGQCTRRQPCRCRRKGQADRERLHRWTANATAATFVMMMMVMVVLLFVVIVTVVFIQGPAPGP